MAIRRCRPSAKIRLSSTAADQRVPIEYELSPLWVPEDEVTLRAARVPSGYRPGAAPTQSRGRRVLGEWLAGASRTSKVGRSPRTISARAALRGQDRRSPFPSGSSRRTAERCSRRRRSPGTTSSSARGPIRPAGSRLGDHRAQAAAMAHGLARHHQRDQRTTVIGATFPKWCRQQPSRWYVGQPISAPHAAAFVGLMSTWFLTSRRGTRSGVRTSTSSPRNSSRSYRLCFQPSDLDFITPRVLALSYTSHAMRLWAEDLGHQGPPFAWDDERRARLRAELDAFFAMKYGSAATSWSTSSTRPRPRGRTTRPRPSACFRRTRSPASASTAPSAWSSPPSTALGVRAVIPSALSVDAACGESPQRRRGRGDGKT